MSRGNRRAPIVHSDSDRLLFLSELEREVDERGWISLAYCVMSNHFHLVVETPEPNLGDGMRAFLSRFAQKMNRRQGFDGHLFKSRYRSVLVESDEQFACLLRYVAVNPVKAQLCRDPTDYAWSSHAQTLRRRGSPLVAVGRIEELLACWGGVPAQRYARLFAADSQFGPWDEATEPYPKPPALADLFSALSLDDAIRQARMHGYRLREIAALAGLSESAISRRCRR